MKRILTVDNKKDKIILETPSTIVNFETDDVSTIVNDMKIVLNNNETGVGLHANQIGVSLKMFMMDSKKNGFYKVFINPIVLRSSKKTIVDTEECLSRPGKSSIQKRAQSIQLQYYNEHGKKKVARFYGLEARIILHEMDHGKGLLV